MLRDSLPMAARIARFIPNINITCVTYGFNKEDPLPLFRNCTSAATTWSKFLPLISPPISPNKYNTFLEANWQPWLYFNLLNFDEPNCLYDLPLFVGFFDVTKINVFLKVNAS